MPAHSEQFHIRRVFEEITPLHYKPEYLSPIVGTHLYLGCSLAEFLQSSVQLNLYQ